MLKQARNACRGLMSKDLTLGLIMGILGTIVVQVLIRNIMEMFF